MVRIRVPRKYGVQREIELERSRQNADFNRRLKNAEDSMKAIYPEEYLKIRSRYFGNGNNLGLIDSQFNYIHNMITRNSDDQMKKYYNELKDYFVKQTGTEPGYMLPVVDVVDEAPDFNALRQKDFDRFYSPTENSDYINTVEKENARNAYLALQNKNGDGTFDHDGYFDYDPNNGLLNTEANYARATGSYNYTPEEREAAATWERAQNSPIVTAMEFSPLFPVVAGVKAAIASNAPQASGVDVGMNAAFAVLPALLATPKIVNKLRSINNKIPQKIKLSTSPKYQLWTPEQWTSAQDAAIEMGDIAEAHRLRDLHFKVSAPNTQIKDIQYHGAKGNATFNVFDPKLIGQTDQGWAGRGYYFTPSKDYAKMYGSEPRAFYINAQKVHDGTASTYFGREDSPAARAFKIVRKKHGNDGQQILDDLASSDAIRTSFSQTRPYNGTFEEVVTRNNNQMKLADAVTYDDNGVRIPLGLRDNFNVNDIRYGLTTLGTTGLGLGLGYKFLKNQHKQSGDEQVYSNGGVLDATYIEQINRIRQPRFVGWRFKDGGIHIKEENRGRLTRLKERTGKTEEELYRTGDKHTRQMITFARNARKWKHDDGGSIPPYYKSFDEWYNSLYQNNDTTDYNLRRAYELAPTEELENWKIAPETNHLHTVYWNGDEYEFMKKRNHPTLKNELDWYNSKDGAKFRMRYALDTTGDTYRYVPRYKVRIVEPLTINSIPTYNITKYETGGPENPPFNWSKAWTDAQTNLNETKSTGHYNVVATPNGSTKTRNLNVDKTQEQIIKEQQQEKHDGINQPLIGYTEPFNDKGMFFEDWYNDRLSQIKESLPSYLRQKVGSKYTYWPWNKDEAVNELKKGFLNSINTNYEYTIDDAEFIPKGLTDVIDNSLNQRISNYDGSNLSTKTKLEYRRILGTLAGEFPNHDIIYFDRKKDVPNTTKIHERTHSGDDATENILSNKIYSDYSWNYNPRKENIKKDYYLDDAKEIYSRLNEFRFRNKINPKKIWTLEEIKQIPKDKLKEVSLDRYTDEFILHLFNDVAVNDNNNYELDNSQNVVFV